MMLQAPSLAALPSIRHGFFMRGGGVSDGPYASLNGGTGSRDGEERVAENRRRMAAALAVTPDRLLTAYQVHSCDVVVARTPWPADARPRADAIVTHTPGLAIGVTTADCGPLLLADAQAGVIGAAHAGWRGALGGVIEATIDAMEAIGAARARIAAALGPMIRQPSYEVGEDLWARFRVADVANERFFAPGAIQGRAQFDLAGYVLARLGRAGVLGADDIGRCTYAQEGAFFSYRRATRHGEDDYGRHINAIALVG
ncbi:MAG: peptidoglycan editing factor PgeF [Proteobacteria bacterium]|nr:peptidoglycan editing factor PgeF [Pseudomonadota bacterium]